MKKEINLEELKKIELNIMKKIHQFCEDNNIKYFLCYGTLIGAIRHNGYIPWDDDIDIHMLRKDYDKFIKLFPSWGEENGLYIASIDSKEHFFPRNLIKVCDAKTELYEKAYKRKNTIGAFVDIWPLDNVPNLNFQNNLWIKKIHFYESAGLFSDIDINYANEHMNNRNKLLVKFFNMFNTYKLVKKAENLSKKFYEVENIKFYKTFEGDNSLYLAEDFSETVLHKFEDSMFYVPIGYDRILRTLYGDYMKLPPKDQQEPHHVQNVWYK